MKALAAAVVAIVLSAASAFGQVKAWVETSGTMIMEDRPAGKVEKIELKGVRNEYVCAQIGLRGGQDGSAVKVEWTGLKGSASEIAKENVTLFRAAGITVDFGSESKKDSAEKDPLRVRLHGTYPDALVPFVLPDGTKVIDDVKCEKDKTIALWVDVFIPEKTAPGKYEGKIDIKGAGAIPLAVEVLPVTIPADASIPSIYNLRIFDHVHANLDNYVDEIMRHRIQPTQGHYLEYPFKKGFSWADMDKLNPNGKGFVSIYIGATDLRNSDEWLAPLKEATARLKERGLFDKSVIYLKDEPTSSEEAGMVDVAKLILKEVPEWKGKLLDTLNHDNSPLDPMLTHYSRALKCYGDWTSPDKPYWGRQDWDKKRDGGQQLWFYVSNAQGTPFPTFDVHSPNMGFEARVNGWAWWYEKAYGHLYWDLATTNGWKLTSKFPPGDGQLLYPGDLTMAGAPDWTVIKDLKRPVISRRMKEFRQGIQEWELLRMAEKKAGREAVTPIVDKVYRSMGMLGWSYKNHPVYDPKKPMWSYSEADWDAARSAVIDLLMKK